MVVIKSLCHAVKVRDSSQDDENVEDLMRAAPDVERSRCDSLRPANLANIRITRD